MLAKMLARRVVPIALGTTLAFGAVAPNVGATTLAEGGSTPVGFSVDRGSYGSAQFNGTLTWDGEGGYTVSGQVGVNLPSPGRMTAWLEYGGEREGWKQSNEADTGAGGHISKVDYANVNVSGKIPKGDKLELRVSSWMASINAYKASPKQQFVIS
ncbi:hypothetical protein [Kitasatospora sp. NPDC098663]|uniref:hypothetical protein n=1 Tax=Kitasatospora sp. NPDC098663 TaxID=3364096 RepID=UPI0037FD4692